MINSDRGSSFNELSSLLRLAFPIIISFTIRSMFTFVDTIYAAFLSDAAIAAIGLTIPFEFVMIALWVGASAGLTSYLSKGIMSKDPARDYDIYIRAGWYIVYFLIPAFALVGVGVYFLAPLLELDAQVQSEFQIYGTVLIVGSAFTAFWSVIPDSIIKAHHDTKSTMIAGMLSNFTNIALNTLFLFVFEWGIFGIAFSTVLSRFSALVYALWRANALECERITALTDSPDPSPASREICKTAVRQILAIAIPSGLAYSLMSLEGLYVNWLLTGVEESTAAVAAYGIYYRISMFAFMPLIATAVAILPYVARKVQLGGIQDILFTARGIMVIGLLYCLLVVSPMLLLWSDDILSFLTDSQAMLECGSSALLIVIPMSIVTIPIVFTKPILEGFQRGRPVIVLSVLRHVVFAVPLCYIGRNIAPSFGYTSFEGIMAGLFTSSFIAGVTAWSVTSRIIQGAQSHKIPN